MPFLLVLIRKSKWQGTVPDFHGTHDVPADCLTDLHIENNELSAWWIDNEKSNLNRVLTALAATRERFSHVDYMTFDFDLPSGLNIALRKTTGETADAHANYSWHYDLTDLSARKVAELAVAIHSSFKDRIQEKVVRGLIQSGVGKELERKKINPKLATELLASAERKSLWTRVRRTVEKIFLE